MRAWKGLTAEGPVQMGRVTLKGDEAPFDVIAFAYNMEQALGEFYTSAARMMENREALDLLTRLAGMEDGHKKRLFDLYRSLDISGKAAGVLEAGSAGETMEGGFSAAEFLQENRSLMGNTADILSLAMMLETQALDLYLRYSHGAEDDESRRVLLRIAEDEKAHLRALGHMMEAVHNEE
ncbi:MAG: ferritin family protein [Deltaproteobacteria bacterium]|nr:ferritin family protein [Deltaproteobacteria bacterium]MBW2047576.1 ferritin family protein [Deltaproteobacteria bacterium]MBW2352228.1 ferritin family protein [Deltaproteobacteria bacterium]